MTATETKRPEPDVARFKANKHRVTEFFEHNADHVRKKVTLMTSADVFAEMKWLCEECERFGGPAENQARFEKVKHFVGRVHQDHGGAIAGGQFVKAGGDIFAGWRFLVRCVEAAYARHLDAADRFALGARMPEEHAGRIELDLTAGLGDDDPPADPAAAGEKKKKG